MNFVVDMFKGLLGGLAAQKKACSDHEEDNKLYRSAHQDPTSWGAASPPPIPPIPGGVIAGQSVAQMANALHGAAGINRLFGTATSQMMAQAQMSSNQALAQSFGALQGGQPVPGPSPTTIAGTRPVGPPGFKVHDDLLRPTISQRKRDEIARVAEKALEQRGEERLAQLSAGLRDVEKPGRSVTQPLIFNPNYFADPSRLPR